MDINSIISKKRAGSVKGELTSDEIKYFIGKWVKGEIKDSQAAALMSYIYTNGLTEDEIIRFVIEVGNSGDVLNLSQISDNIVDKHSTRWSWRQSYSYIASSNCCSRASSCQNFK